MEQVSEGIGKFLVDKKPIILSKWFNYLCQEYPEKTQKHLKSDKSQFQNPVGHNTYQGLEGILDEFLGGMETEKLSTHLDKILRIKAVQDFSASKAVAFVFLLKNIIRNELETDWPIHKNHNDYMAIDKRIDDISLLAFEVYMKCRETIYQLRIDEVKKRIDMMERINLLNSKHDVKCETDQLKIKKQEN